MNRKSFTAALFAGGTMAAIFAAPLTAPALAQDAEVVRTVEQDPLATVEVSQGKGTLLRLPRPISDIFVVNPDIADVEVKSNREVYIYGTGGGETSVYATNARGETVYSATVRVVRNIDQVREMMRLAMPQANVEVKSLGGIAFLTGTVASPAEVAEAEALVRRFTGQEEVVNRLQAAVPPQVNLRVRFAEVSRDLLKQLGVSFQAFDGDGDLLLGLTRGSDVSGGEAFVDGFFGRNPITGDPTFDVPELPVGSPALTGTLIGSLLGLDFNAAIDALETDGLLTTLAEPNLTALSGETASFLAGGEFPVVTNSGLNGTNVQYKNYGVGIEFTPVVHNDNRITMRVAPSVSELSEAGAVRIDGISIPALITREAQTTVELGSGQSFMIGGLTRNSFNTSTDKVPLLGDLPIIGTLFKSDSFRRSETELVIIITPYLVNPVSGRMALPTDGMRAPNDAERWLLGRTYSHADAPPPRDVNVPEDAPAPGFSVQ
ncbi:type II and III secretion system protein family protein [Pacificimonas flava]|uniref:Type II/IV secretion system secretin RcpA/CpaC, associated with Flp pilus assembly n=1 Tax=Pacificimonas flava TaxID=1234595 RepID=M2T9I0_9SPHN|nr:type II and III secretion system protein family protein [Pacificimonas flava]EMD83229.1 Type II/IV secretion system secretin RcpA/CpaC, associated with Flp pilus assembly [Pacificimonas flava]MBB5279207.1 pilus assembly protein CpaC [Pacificimonas flava]